jgi:hypothetical protein
LKFDRVDDAIGVVEHLMAVVASSKNAVLTIDGAASMANPREVTISGPAELASRVQAAISSSGTCQPELGAHYPGIYINRDQGYWIDWGLRIAPRNRENGCGQPLTRQFKEPGTHRVLAGMMTPGKSKQTSVMPLEWKWFGTVVVTVK